MKRSTGSDSVIFVFGSNLSGYHGAGAAVAAMKKYGAKWGVGEGRTGMAYGIPTKDGRLKVRPLHLIAKSVEKFLEYAEANPDCQFLVTRVGCGLAGYQDHEIAPFFIEAPSNCILPEGWRNADS